MGRRSSAPQRWPDARRTSSPLPFQASFAACGTGSTSATTTLSAPPKNGTSADPEVVRHLARQGLHLQRLLHRPILRVGRTLRGRASGNALPGLRAHYGDGERRELLLQAVGLRAQAAGVLRRQPRLYGPESTRREVTSFVPAVSRTCPSAARAFPGASPSRATKST